MALRTLLVSLAAAQLACLPLFAAEPVAKTTRAPSKLFVDVLDQDKNVKVQRVRIDLRSAKPVQAQYSNPIVSTPGAQEACSLRTFFSVHTGYAIECTSTSSTPGTKVVGFGDCEINDEQHPALLQYVSLREDGPNWLISTSCVME